MKGFRELQIEDARDINDGVQHATLLNVTGASGWFNNGTNNHGGMHFGDGANTSPDWTNICNMASQNAANFHQMFLYAIDMQTSSHQLALFAIGAGDNYRAAQYFERADRYKKFAIEYRDRSFGYRSLCN